MSWHQTIIQGSLGKDPELRYLQSGTAVCNFSVAVNERWRDRKSNEWKEKTTWYRVAAWDSLAETCNTHLQKGSSVLVVGNAAARAWVNNDGDAVASLEVTARDVRFLGGQSGGGRQQRGQQQQRPQRQQQGQSNANPDDVPF